MKLEAHDVQFAMHGIILFAGKNMGVAPNLLVTQDPRRLIK
jgi:hypothetical protein